MIMSKIIIFLFILLLTVLFEIKLIPLLTKKAKQPIYSEGPSWHIKKKGTPTMGGIGFLIPLVLVLLPISIFHLTNRDTKNGLALLLCLCFALGNGLIGIVDDLTKLKRERNAGLTPAQKLMLQLVLAVAFIALRSMFFPISTILRFSFFEVDIGIFYYPLSLLLLLGIVNCANLTDGIDGLAATVSLVIGTVLCLISTKFITANLIGSALSGAAAGFLIFNRHPARIFMGDTGSLTLGALVVSALFFSENPLSVIFIGGVYGIEGISVILQVAVYKISKKRIFKMAPLHHHLEKSGFSENKICLLGAMVTIILSLLARLIFNI